MLGPMDDGWTVIERDDRTFDLFEDGKAILYSLPSLDDAELEIQAESGTEYTFIEKDGYQTRRFV